MEPVPTVPITDEQVRTLAALAGLEIAPEHLAGVVRNLGVLLGQARLVGAAPLDPLVEPAAVFTA